MLALKRIEEIIEDDHASAYVLDTYGIDFYHCLSRTLGEVCRDRGINLDYLVHNLHSVNKTSSLDLETLKSYPIDLVIEYLKHAHHIFIRKSLPYVTKLVNNLDESKFVFPYLVKDLKFVMPLFIEDFIHHIHEEEDHLFHYINLLFKAKRGDVATGRVYHLMEKTSLSSMASEHENTDDEMLGIRRITKNYTFGFESDLLLRTIYRELQQFERELILHADIENHVLFPKAIALEEEVKTLIGHVIPSN